MMTEAMESIEEGINVGGKVMQDVRFAGDQRMIGSIEKGFQKNHRQA